MADDEKAPIIIIKKVKKSGDGHHGGAWKVAYADFVTAMMAFFLLLWLLNVSTDEQKALISSYFSPADPRVSVSQSGSGGVMGGLTISKEGAMTNRQAPIMRNEQKKPNTDRSAIQEAQEAIDKERFEKAEAELRKTIASKPEFQNLAQHLLIDQTPEGLRIQIVDQKGKPMFPLGKFKPLPEAQILLKLVTKVIMDLPNMISIRGHTDSRPYGKGAKYTNWELSADRANASRRAMLEYDMDIKRIENVMGKADREHLIIDEPNSARNRRISIILLKESIVKGIHKEKPEAEKTKDIDKKIKIKEEQKPKFDEKPIAKEKEYEEGIIYFP